MENKEEPKEEPKEPLNPSQQAAKSEKDGSPHPSTSGKRRGPGRIVSVQGPVVDCYFEDFANMPSMYDVVEVETIDGEKLILQTMEHLTKHAVRTVSLMDTNNVQLNSVCYNTFQPITIPMGDGCYGRVMDATGRPIDNGGEYKVPGRVPIRYLQKPVPFNLANKKGLGVETLETGIKYF